MSNNHLYFLLETIVQNGDARRLTLLGLTYKTIGELTHYSLLEGFTQIDENKRLRLTEKGYERYEADMKTFKRTNKDLWIQPHMKSKISKIGRNDIFLPDQKELTF